MPTAAGDGGGGSGIGGTAGGNDGSDQIWRYRDEANGSWGSGTDYQSVVRAMRAGGTGIGQGGVGVVRTELANANRRCVDTKGSPKDNPRFELAVVDPKDHKEGLHWDASDAKGSGTAGRTAGDGTVISPDITPGMLRDRNGKLPFCTAPNSGVYDPNGHDEKNRCTLRQWPSGNATYVFRTKVGDNNAYYGGENLYHNSDWTDPEEQWTRDTWGLRTTAPTTPPTAGSNTPVQDQISLKVNDNPMDVYAIHARIAVSLHHSTDTYGGKETLLPNGKQPAAKTTSVDWTSGMDDPPANGYYPVADGLPDFTPSYFGWDAWRPGYYWFDVKILANGSWKQNNTQLQYCTANYNTPECLNHTSPKGGTPLGADVSHPGAHDMAERFRIRTYTLTGTTKASVNGATGGNANAVSDTLTLTANGSNVDVSKLTTEGVKFTLGYSRNGYGRTEKYSAKKTGRTTGRTVTSPNFAPADLFGKDAKRWQPGYYWFDVSAPTSAVTSPSGTHPDGALNLYGANVTAEKFRIPDVKPVSVQLQAKKHWKKNASKTIIQQFQAELFQGKTTDAKALLDTQRFAAANKDGTEGTATFKARQYDINSLGNATEQTFTFTIREKAAGTVAKGVTTDATVHTATVRVWIDKNGAMQKEVKYDGKADLPEFTNSYKPKPTSFPLEAMKKLKDDNGTALHVAKGQFTFDLKDKDGKALQTKTTDDGGKATFDPITITDKETGGKARLELDYTISEAKGKDPYMEYDTKPHTVHVTIDDDGEGQLHVTSIVYDGRKGQDGTPEKDYVPTVTNTRHSKVMLPITGGMDPLVLAGIGMGVILLAGGTVWAIRRRKHAMRRA